MSTVIVQSDRSIAFEIGLERGCDHEHKGTLVPGPKYQCAQIRPGLNTVDATLAREWFRKNSKILECVKEHKIRIVEKVSTSQMGSAA